MSGLHTFGVTGYRMLLLQPVLERRLNGSLWMTWLLLGAAGFSLLAFGLGMHDWRAGMVVAAVMLGALVLMWWLLFVGSAICQNAPAQAWLVPHLHGRLVRAAALLWVAGTAVIGLAFGIPLGHVGYALLAGGALLLFVAAMQAFPWLTVLPLAFMVSQGFLPADPVMKALAATVGEPLLAAGGLILLAALGAATLRRILPRGGDRHHAWQRRLVERGEAAKSGGVLPGAPDPAGNRPSRWRDALYFAGLRRASRPGGHLMRARNRADALLYGLGTASHWGPVVLGQLCAMALVTVAGRGMLAVKDPQGMAVMFCTTLLMMPMLVHVHAVLTAMQRSRAEQALLRLCPAAPDAASFNRQFGAVLLQRFLLVWLAATAGTLVAAGELLPGPLVRTTVAATAALTLLFGAFLLRDYASLRRMRLAFGIAVTLLIVAGVGLRVLIASTAHALPWWLVAGLAALAALVLALRLRRMATQPLAFPAARLATD